MSVVIIIPRRVAEHARREAEKKGMTLEEYIIELLSHNLDPMDKAIEYVEAAQELLREAVEELGKGNLRQASEKLWGATALTVKAYALHRDGKQLRSHGELWEYKDKLVIELGEWVYDAWMAANGMHTCFYEGWCSARDVEIAIKHIEKLVNAVKETMNKTRHSTSSRNQGTS
ncbi:PaREP1/PaREP8 domain containing family protein [Staphylothermus marinus F1]|uniref:PaREP1/PaREP8 domain containing family protein n=1 Tax=Staphylothermus marinus (strain ATCC 43588 / DSM 3639 / JCM 9404 / F1) TaxID=399550 RepID=A3DPQ1_STAMF|nr:PaREP1 family protein [Staphylothermus marinus]ABN70611.1 PaREP1/PaREP8 domain containing family protein [Staphylothermus marinus F1]